jgi:hypothetical protein
MPIIAFAPPLAGKASKFAKQVQVKSIGDGIA